MGYDGDGSFVLEDIYYENYLVRENIHDVIDEEIVINDS
jgi:hypothetical protein